jgi:hypothetical protein
MLSQRALHGIRWIGVRSGSLSWVAPEERRAIAYRKMPMQNLPALLQLLVAFAFMRPRLFDLGERSLQRR